MASARGRNASRTAQSTSTQGGGSVRLPNLRASMLGWCRRGDACQPSRPHRRRSNLVHPSHLRRRRLTGRSMTMACSSSRARPWVAPPSGTSAMACSVRRCRTCPPPRPQRHRLREIGAAAARVVVVRRACLTGEVRVLRTGPYKSSARMTCEGLSGVQPVCRDGDARGDGCDASASDVCDQYK